MNITEYLSSNKLSKLISSQSIFKKGKTMPDEKSCEEMSGKCCDGSVINEETKERNNSQIFPMGGHVPVCEIEWEDKERQIAKGKVVFNGTSKDSDTKIIYFSRKYQPEINELDQIYVEIEIANADIIGIPFVLVPKEKLLFGFEEGSAIINLVRKPLSTRRPHVQ